jgi:hypothetical protein
MATLAPGWVAAGSNPAAQASTIIYREDLIDFVINLDKEKKAAVFLAAPKTVANGLIHEWELDQLQGTATGTIAEGADWASATMIARVRMSNAVQTSKFNFGVSLDAVEYALKGRAPGVAHEYEHQVENHLMTMEQSVDAIMCRNADTASASSAGGATGQLTAGFRGYQASASGAAGSAQSAAVTNVAMVQIAGAWSRTRFLALHEFMFGLGADPNTLAVDPGVKADITNDILGEVASATGQPANASAIYGVPTVVRQVHTDSNATEYTADIQFMRTDFGRVAILVDRFIPQAATAANATGGGAFFLYDRSKVRVAFWRPMRHYSLPPGGDSMRGYVHTGFAVEVLTPRAVGIGYNITT